MATALVYNLNRTDKGRKVRVALLKHGVTPRSVRPEEFSLPIGALLGLLPLEPVGEEQPPFPEELLVFHGLVPGQLDKVLSELRSCRAPVALKALVTEHNVTWSSHDLRDHLMEEHAAITRLRSQGPVHTREGEA